MKLALGVFGSVHFRGYVTALTEQRPPTGLSRELGSPKHIDFFGLQYTGNPMKSTVSVSEGQNAFPALVRAAEKGGVVTVTRHDEPVACVIGHERMSAIAETLEVMGNAAAMNAIAEHKAGRTQFGVLDDIPE
jgi:prevent-host-death family protein